MLVYRFNNLLPVFDSTGYKKSLVIVFCFVLLFMIGISTGYSQEKYSIVVDPSADRKVEYGLNLLELALKEKGIRFERVATVEKATGKQLIVVGLSNGQDGLLRFTRTENRIVPAVPEAYAIWKGEHNGKPVLVLRGFDEQVVMYALQEVAMRMGWGTKNQPFEFIEEVTTKPEFETRAVAMYTMHRTVWENKLYDKRYWEKYFDMLSQNRFNSLVIIFGYENGGFLAPPYPYFFDVPGFPDVRMVGLTKEQQSRNLTALNDVIDMAHGYGIRITLGIWDHIYRGGVQAGEMPGLENALREPTPGLVWGVKADNLIPYTKAALSEFIKKFPHIDGIEFRMHWESGLRAEEQEGFWKDIFRSIKAEVPNMNFTLRAKDMPESVVQAALDEGVKFRIESKYWMEQVGMPWHPVHINRPDQMNRRHGYADMLRYPQDYKMYWRLWTGGTQRMLVSGSPEYARRYIESAKIYNGDAYEVIEPLATKMVTMPHDAEPFELLAPQYKYYDYEIERYWNFFHVFGRIGYDLNQSPIVWQKEFERRFGKAALYIEQALHQASWVLPRVVATCYNYARFPTTYGWPEKQALDSLPRYASAEGTDIQIFASFDEEAQLMIENRTTAKLLPSINSVWFKQQSESINDLIRQAENVAGKSRSKEFNSTITDLKILSNMALYHSRRIPAAVNYRLFVRTNDPAALDRAIEHEKNAIQAWKQLIDAAGDVYSKTLNFGVSGGTYPDRMTRNLKGHWIDELVILEEGLTKLEKQREYLKVENNTVKAPEYKAVDRSSNATLFDVKLDIIESNPVNKALKIQAKVTGAEGIRSVRLRYRPMNQMIEYSTLRMDSSGENDVYEATIPLQDINPRFDLMYFIEVIDNAGNGMIYPDFDVQAPYVVVKLVR